MHTTTIEITDHPDGSVGVAATFPDTDGKPTNGTKLASILLERADKLMQRNQFEVKSGNAGN